MQRETEQPEALKAIKLGLRILMINFAVNYWRILTIKIIFKDQSHTFVTYLFHSYLLNP